MHEAIAFLVRETASKLIEKSVDRFFEPRAAAAVGAAPPPEDPVAQAQEVVDAFLCALRSHEVEVLYGLCDPEWCGHPDTAAMLDETLQAALPVSWHLQESYVPGDWSHSTVLPWLIADLAVTFDVGDGRYETIPAVIGVANGTSGWEIYHLEWGSPEPAPQDIFQSVFGFSIPSGVAEYEADYEVVEDAPSHSIVACAGCGQKLRVPCDKGRLRVRCPKCNNVQWHHP